MITVLTLILSILLFPPAALALISNNAVPGDATYPIKRFLEDRIYDVASLNPTTKAWFSAARSDRRFKEFSTLIAQGKSASDTLNELVSQTDIAANELAKVEDPVRKQELVSQLSQFIDKYSQKLDEVSIGSQPPSSTTTPIPTVVSPAPSGSTLTPQPSETPRPVPSPTPAPSSPQAPVDQKDLDNAKDKLEDIKDKLEKEEKKSHQEKREDKREDRKNDEKEKDSKKDKNKEDEKDNSKTGKTDKKSDN